MIWAIAVVFLLAAMLALYIYINRDPVRAIKPGKTVVSPADGTIIEVIDLLDLKNKKHKLEIPKGIIGKIRTTASEISDHCYVIIIYMNPLDVHVQRAPVEGKVISTKHKKGKFFASYKIDASVENEKNEILIKNKDIGKIKVIQIAGFMIRRIECCVRKNEKLLKGQKIGRIKLGSQVVLIMPDIPLRVKKGDKVIAGETVIAEY